MSNEKYESKLVQGSAQFELQMALSVHFYSYPERRLGGLWPHNLLTMYIVYTLGTLNDQIRIRGLVSL